MKDVEVGRIYVKVVPDLTGFASDVLSDIKAIEKRLPAIEVDVELDKTATARIQTELDALASGRTVEIDPAMDYSAELRTSAMLEFLARPRHVPIIPYIQKRAAANVMAFFAALSGARLVRSTFKNFFDMVKNLDKAVPIIGGVALAVAGLSGIIIAATADMFSLVRSLAQMLNIGWALPGVLTGIAIGMGTMIVAFLDFNKVLPDVVDKYATLRDIISDNFWDKAAEPMREMAHTLFPAISDGLGRTATALGQWFARLSKGLQDALGPRLEGMFDNLVQSIEIFTGATRGIADIIAVLGSVGASYLPRLATWFKHITLNFADFLKRSEESGDIFDWIEIGIENTKAFGTVLKNIWLIIGDIGRAAEAAGATTLRGLATSLDNIRAITSSPAFQTGMTATFAAAYDMMDRIAVQAGPALERVFSGIGKTAEEVGKRAGDAIGNLVATVLDAMAQPEFSTGMVMMFEGIRQAMEHIHGVAPQLGATFGNLMGIIGVLARGAGPLLAAVFSQIASIVETLAPVIGEIMLVAFSQLTTAFMVLRPYIDQIVVAFTGLLQNAMPLIQAVFPVLRDLLASVLEKVPGLINKFGEFIVKLTELWNFISPVLIPAIQFLIDVIVNAISGVIDGLMNIIDGFINAVTGVWEAFKAALNGDWGAFWSNLGAALDGILQMIWGLIQVWWNGSVLAFLRGGLLRLLTFWKGGWTSVQTVLSGAMNIIKNIITVGWNLVKSTTSAVLKGTWGVIKSIWNAIVAGIKGFINGFVSTIQNGIITASNALQTGWGIIRTTFHYYVLLIRGIVQGFIQAVVGFFRSLRDDIVRIAKAAWTRVKTEFTNARQRITETVKQAWRNVKNAFTGGRDDIIGIAKSIPGRIKSAFGNAGRILWNIGKSIITGLIDGVSSMIGNLRNKFSGITNMIPDWKGPMSKDKKLLKKPGEAIMDGLINAIDDRTTNLRRKMQDITALIEGTSIGAPEVAGMDASYSVRSSMADGPGSAAAQRILNYYAAENRSLPEEDLFEALDRERSWP